jgi:hypothetical protein
MLFAFVNMPFFPASVHDLWPMYAMTAVLRLKDCDKRTAHIAASVLDGSAPPGPGVFAFGARQLGRFQFGTKKRPPPGVRTAAKAEKRHKTGFAAV